jgi:glycosyltransferase involved in cell wall biosynthesis
MISKKVTVYIVNHNYESYLLQCYYSVLYQSYKNIELLIIDNNSSVESQKLLKSISKVDNINIIYREQSDLISACNLAIKMATGEFIVRLDADDYLRKDAIKLLVTAASENNADLTYPDLFIGETSFSYSENGIPLNFSRNFDFVDSGILVKTLDSAIVITHLQFPSKKVITAADAANSYADFFTA